MSFIPSQRELFDIPDHIAYFNCAYYSPLLKESIKKLHDGVESKMHPWNRFPNHFFDDSETIRQLASELIGGDSDGYAIIPSVSYGISTAARILEKHLKEQDQLLLMDEEFPSVVYPLTRIACETGTGVITVTTPYQCDWTNAILEHMDDGVKVVALSSCHWTNGANIDLVKIREACNKHNSILIIDATQSLGAIPFSISEVQPDFLVAAGYKWMLTPYGFTLMYVDKKWRDERPLEENWQSRENAEDFAGLVNYCDDYKAGARRYDMGEKGIPTILPGAIEAFQQLKNWGINNIAETLQQINSQIIDKLEPLGFEFLPEKCRCPHMIGAEIPRRFKGNLVDKLKLDNIFISQRGDSVRFAPHLYVNDSDINKLVEGFNTALNS
ncbi:MAG: aminotransferase class V-fold PLP-dependent enzyme [Bacteroidales bacterium]|nr:aminotransferase class V-fold PLP-dependent enzyme [Bacteroidales bacterium]